MRFHQHRIHSPMLTALMLVVIGTSNSQQLSAQDQPIGANYALPVVLLPPESDEFPELLNQPEAIDLNADGRDDAVYSDYNRSDPEGLTRFFILMANETGTMTLKTDELIDGELPVTQRGFRQVIPADFNGDGRLDLFLETHGGEPDCGDGSVNCWVGGSNNLLLSNEQGRWENVTVPNLPDHSDFSHGSSVGDYDGDGDIDIWVNNLAGSPLYNPNFSYLLANNGVGEFALVADAANPQWEQPLVGRNGILPDGDLGTFWSFSLDANGDGHLDLGLGWSYGLERNIVLMNDGSGGLILPESEAFPSPPGYVGNGVQHALVHDINGDGLEDLLLQQSLEDLTQPMIQVLISNGDGTFRDETAARYPAEPNSSLSDFQLHDLDNDGHLDIFSYVNFNQADIRLNDGAGFFRRIAEDWVPGLQFNSIVLDVDGDGGSDFLTTEGYGLALHKMAQPYGPDLDGTAGDDRLVGGAHDNRFRGFAGNDSLDGGLGNDELNGGPGNDEMNDWVGDETYIFRAADLAGNDLIWDYNGNDTLVFEDFDLDRVGSVSRVEGEHLQIVFTDGGSIVVIAHFAGVGQAIERLQVGDCFYDITQDDAFVSGSVGSAFGDCYVVGSLSGTVVDAADGVTPVHPVKIDLADPVTGAWLGISVTNNADGSYLFEEIPVGAFKVFFNAVGDANNYIDELYADVLCEESGCDIANSGSVVSLLAGANVINVDLTRQVALSGRVFNEAGAALPGAGIEILDESGATVGSLVYTDANGHWVKGVTGSGTYFARSVGESTPGYQAEAWNNIPCDGCDITAEGLPIDVGTRDISNINFELSRIVYAESDCRARALIHSSNFEAQSGREIVITSNGSAVFTAPDQQAEFTVQLLDEQGAPVDPSRLEWCLTNSKNLKISSSGGSATVTATSMAVESAELVVRDPVSLAEERALIIFAELHGNAFSIADNLFLEGETPASGDTGVIVLERTAFTETLEAGMVIASGDRLAILVRILSVTVLSETVELIVEPAGLHEFYARVKIEAQTEPQQFRLVTETDGSASLQKLDREGNVTQDFKKFGFECDVDAIAGAVAPKFDVIFNTNWFVNYEAEPPFGPSWDIFSYGSIPRNGGSITFDVSLKVGPNFSCRFVDFPALPVAGFPFGPVVLGFGLQPDFGLAGSVTGPASLFKVPAPSLKINRFSWAAGLSYDFLNKLQPFSDPTAFTSDVELIDAPDPESAFEDEFQAQIKPFVGGSLQFGVLPRGPMFGLISYQLGFPLTAGISKPLDWRDRNYIGPSWKFELTNEFTFDTDLNNFLQNELAKKLGGDFGVGLDIETPLYARSIVLDRSPTNPTLDVVCQPGECPVDVARFDYFAWSVDFPSDYVMGEGRTELVGWKDGTGDAVSLSTDPLLFDGANGEWWPQQADTGNWNFRAMVWDRDLLNIGKFFPYPTPYSTANYEVGTTWTLNVTLSGAGKVTSSPAGIDCQWVTYPQTCGKEYADGTPITLTAHEVDGYVFVRWENGGSPNYACAGSTSKTCAFDMVEDTFAWAYYEQVPVYPVTVTKQKASGETTSGGLVTSVDGIIDCGSACSTLYNRDASVTLTAADTPAARFIQWADDSQVCPGSIVRQCSFDVSGPIDARAEFAADKVLTIRKDGSGPGTIVSTAEGITCGPGCNDQQYSIVENTWVTLVASSQAPFSFRQWSGDSSVCAGSTDPECTFQMTDDVNVTARFEVKVGDIPFADNDVRECVLARYPTGAESWALDIYSLAMRSLNGCDNAAITNLSGLEYLQNLDYLLIDGGAISDGTALGQLPNLRSIILRGSYSSSKPFSDIGFLSGLTQIEVLDLTGVKANAQGWSAVSTLTGLKVLDLPYAFTDSSGIQRVDNSHMERLAPLVNLEELNFNTSGSEVSSISALASLTKMKRLTIYSPPGESGGLRSIGAVRNMPELTHLLIRNNNGTNAGLFIPELYLDLAPLSGATKLEYLYIQLRGVSNLAAISSIPTLGQVTFINTGIRNMAGLSGMTQLRNLTFHWNFYEDQNRENQAPNISALSTLSGLESLSLFGNFISDASPVYPLQGQMNSINFRGNQLDCNQVKALLSRFPGSNVSGNPGESCAP